MLVQRLQSPEEQIAEARWWVAELALDLPPGTTRRLLQRAKFWLFDLRAQHHAGRLAPVEYTTDDEVPF